MNEEYINELHRLYGKNAEGKIQKIEKGIEKSITEYELDNIKELDNLHYNYIFSAYSRKYKQDVMVKIILDDTLDSEEIEMLELYNGNNSVKLIAKDKENSILVLELVKGEILAEEQDKEKQVKALCGLIDKLVVEKKDGDSTLILEYKSLVKKAIIKNIDLNNEKEEYKEQINRLEELKDKIITTLNCLEDKIKERYYLHGDLHTYNVIKSQNGYLAIDPHGVIGVKSFEYNQYILNEIWNNKEIEEKTDIKLELEKVINLIVKYSNEKKEDIEKATIVHAYLTALWFIEDNGSKSAVDKNIKIIDILLSNYEEII